MAAYLFSELLAEPSLASAFDPSNDVLDLQAPANRVTVLREGAKLSFTTAAGTVLLPVSWDQIANPDGSSDIILCSSGRLVIGDTALADTHLADPTAGDQFHGRGGDDSFIGGLGDDIAYGNKGSDYLFGSAGDDTLYGGQSGTGTEVIAGGVGNDLIYGNLGADSLMGDGGDDVLYGGQGDDTFKGGSGDDAIYGNRGADQIYGNQGADFIDGGPDNDRLYGGQGEDFVLGGSGNDAIYGNLDDDILKGETASDSLFGGQGDDWMVGGGGDDLLLGNKGSDTLIGNMGADTFRVAPGSGTDVDVITDFEIGVDSLVLRDVIVLTNGVEQEGPNVRVYLNSGDQILFHNQLRADIIDLTYPFTILGGGGGGGGSTGGTSGGSTGGTTTPSNTAPTVAAALTMTASEDDIVFTQDLLEGAGDADGDTLSITTPTITGDAAGMILDGTTLSIDPAAYNSLAEGESAVITYNYQITDGNGGNVDQTATITIIGANDAPTVAGALASTASEDDGSYTFDLLSGAGDPDVSDTLSISGLSVTGNDAGITRDGNQLSIDPAAYNALAAGESAVITYAYQVTDGNDGSVDQTATITITGANDAPSAPSLDWAAVTGATEDVPIPLNITSALSGGDGNYTLSIVVSGLPAGASLSTGTDNLDGSWTLTAAQLSGLQLILAENDASDPTITVTAIDTNNADGETAETSETQTIGVAAVADAPTLTVSHHTNIGSSFLPGGGEFLVNVETYGRQEYSKGITLNDGNTVVLWQSDHGTGGWDTSIQGQLFDINGLPIGSEFQVNSYTPGRQTNPEASPLADGGFVVVWESRDQNGLVLSVRGQRYDANGSQMGEEFLVNTTIRNAERNPSVATLDNGDFVVVWNSGDVFGQRYGVDGTPIGGEFQINTTSQTVPGLQLDFPDIVALTDGGFVVTWQLYGDVFGQRFASNGMVQGGEFRVNTHTADTQAIAHSAALADGGWVTSWQSMLQDGSDWGVYAQRFDATGTPVDGEFQVNTTTIGGQGNHDITELPNGGFAVFWQSRDALMESSNIYGQTYNAAGAATGGEFKVNSDANSFHGEADVTLLKDGGLLVTWMSPSGTSWDIFGQSLFTDTSSDIRNVHLGVSASLVDTDGSETLSVTITGVPDGASLSAGTDQGGGSWLLTPAQLDGLFLTASTDLWGNHDLTITATALESENGSAASTVETVTLYLGVKPNSNPTVSAPVTSTSGEDNAAHGVDLLAGASDADGDSLSVTGLSLSSGDGSGITRNSNTLSVDPSAYNSLAAGESAVITYTYQITDGQGGSVDQTATITITGANDAPTVAGALSSTTSEDDGGFTFDLLTGAGDPDGDALSITGLLVSGNTAGMSLSGNIVTVDPGAYSSLVRGETVVVTYGYTIADGHGGSVNQTATITVTGANIAPTVGDPVASTTSEDGAAYSVDLLAGASDAENDSLSVVGLGLTSGDGSGISQSGNGLSVNPAAYNFLAVGESAIVTYSYQIIDSFGGSVNQTATITITGANDAPTVAGALASTASEDDGIYTFDLLQGAGDPEGDVLSITTPTITGDDAGITRNGSTLSIDPTAYNSLAVGEDAVITYAYQITDGQGGSVDQTANVTITGANDAPTVAGALARTVTEDDPYYGIDMLTGAGDPDGDTLSISGMIFSGVIKGFSINGQILLCRPWAFNYLGEGESEVSTFWIFISDDLGAEYMQTLNITTLGVNDAPRTLGRLSAETENDDAPFTLDLLSGAIDDDGDSLSITVLDVVGNTAGLSLDGTILSVDPSAYPDLPIGGSTRITYNYSISDGRAETYQSATITIYAANIAPTVDSALSLTVNEDDTLVALDLLSGSADPENDVLSVVNPTVAGDDSGMSLDGNVLTIDPGAHNSLAVGESATAIYSYGISDGKGGLVEQTATVTINGANDAPVAPAPLVGTAYQGDIILTLDLLAGATDPDDSDTLAIGDFTITGDASGATLEGSLLSVDVGAYNFLGVDEKSVFTYSYSIIDGNGGSVNQTATVTVEGYSLPPPILTWEPVIGAEEDTAIALDISAALQTSDGIQALSVVVSGLPDGSSLSAGTNNQDGSWTLSSAQLTGLQLMLAEHDASDPTITVSAIATNVASGSTTETVDTQPIAVTPVADPPKLSIGLASSDGALAVDSEFRINTTTINDQLEPSLTLLSNGGFVACWYSKEQDGSGGGVYARIYDESGNPLTGEIQANAYTEKFQYHPTVSGLPDGGFVIAWQSYQDEGGANYGIYGRRFDASGNPVSAEIRINSYTTLTQSHPSIATLSDGGFVVTWTSYQDDHIYTGGYHYATEGIYGQRYDASGVKVGGEFHVNTHTYHAQWNSHVAALSDGGFLVTWESMQEDEASSLDIHGQRYDAGGNAVGDEFQINSFTLGPQKYPNATGLRDGGFIVTWNTDNQDGSGYSVQGQIYDANGIKIGEEFQINTYTKGNQASPDVTALTGGGFVVVWSSEGQDGSSHGIYGQVFDETGNRRGSEFQLNSYVDDLQNGPDVLALEGGGFIVAWNSLGQDGGGSGIYARRFAPPLEEDATTELGLSASLVDTDGSETLSILITDMPEGASLSAGTDNGDGSWSLTPDLLPGLVFTPPEGFAGGITLTVTATATESSNGDTASTSEVIGLIYGAVDDTLVGTTGPDVLTGGGGNDTLTGGSGADMFLYSNISTDGHDVITDFVAGSDVVALDALFDALNVDPVARADLVLLSDDGIGNSILTIAHADGANFSITFESVVSTDLTLGTDIWLSD